MIPCGPIKTTNNHVCAIKQEITFKLHLKCSLGNILRRWLIKFSNVSYQENTRLSTVRSLFLTHISKSAFVLIFCRCFVYILVKRVACRYYYYYSFFVSLLENRGEPRQEVLLFFCDEKSRFKTMVVCLGATTYPVENAI